MNRLSHVNRLNGEENIMSLGYMDRYVSPYHRIREAVAAGYINLHHIPGTENIADVLTKPERYSSVVLVILVRL